MNKYTELDFKVEYHKKYLDNILRDIGIKHLDQDQRRVVVSNYSNLLVIAGAGSGKTTTMLAKIKFLVEKLYVKPSEILMISYTNTIVDELKEKVNSKMGIDCEISTFHKLGKNILDLFYDNFSVVDEDSYFPLSILSYILERDYFHDRSKLDLFMKYFGSNIFLTKGETRVIFNETCLLNNINTLEDNISDIDIYDFKYIDEDKFKNMTSKQKTYYYLFLEKERKIKPFLKNTIKPLYDKSHSSNKSLSSISTKELTAKDKLLLEIAIKFTYEYNKQKIFHDKKDIDDLITESKRLVESNNDVIKNNLKYKYIIIDEFQDISQIRFDLIKSLSTILNSKVVAVGDDWQSIYGFSGSDISLFYDFEKHYPNTKVLKIENTYRNSQELIDVAGEFIMKNKLQITKQLKSNKKINNPIISYSIDNDEEDNKKWINQALVNSINDITTRRGNNCDNINIAILCRYNFEEKKFKDNELFSIKDNIITYKDNPKLKICLYTVHSSKGLGFDEVILLNAKNGSSGFPARKKNEYLIDLFNNKEDFDQAEERRLFYVACTRTKNRLYIIKPNKASIFYEEIKKYVTEDPVEINVDSINNQNNNDVPTNNNDINVAVKPDIKNITAPWLNTDSVNITPPLLEPKTKEINNDKPKKDNFLNESKVDYNTNSKIKTFIKTDYDLLNEEKVENGKKGEEHVLEYEKQRLIDLGLSDYIDQIIHTSLTDDSAGYDIKSYDYINGSVSPILIEVKSTKGDYNKPFIITNNELKKSKEYSDIYRLYRVYNIHSNHIDIKVYSGSLDNLELTATRYTAKLK